MSRPAATFEVGAVMARLCQLLVTVGRIEGAAAPAEVEVPGLEAFEDQALMRLRLQGR